MNKELIKTYKTEFDHWVNDGFILTGFRDLISNQIKWYPSITNPFIETSTSRELIVIINDEYVEFRKALAEGKTVQFHYINSTIGLDEWQTIKDVNELTFSHSIDLYRIEPEEPQFKVGDWIKNNSSNIVFRYTNDMLKPDLSCCEPWQPEPGKWCWFWDISWQYPQLLQFDGIDDNIFKSKTTIEIGDVDCCRWSHCEPFIGQLPSICKE